MDSLTLKVAARYQRANQPPGQRSHEKSLVKPINPPKGIDRSVAKDNGKASDELNDEQIEPHRRDIRPEDVFVPRPRNMSVRNLAETGKDMERAIQKQIPKDKGYDTVKNLSQYLVRTDGGGGTPPVGT